MPIDLNLLRAFKGGVPDLVRLSQKKRFANVGLVDEVIALDEVSPNPCVDSCRSGESWSVPSMPLTRRSG